MKFKKYAILRRRKKFLKKGNFITKRKCGVVLLSIGQEGSKIYFRSKIKSIKLSA